MATGNCIIASANGEINRVIEEAKCGYCVPAEDYKELANKILEFSKKDKKEKEKMRENSHRYYLENFEKNIFIKNLTKILMKEGN